MYKFNQMVRKLIIPSQTNVSIEVPKNYIGKEIEVLLYAVEELEKNETTKMNAAVFKEIFSKEEGIKFNNFIDQSRNEWERNI